MQKQNRRQFIQQASLCTATMVGLGSSAAVAQQPISRVGGAKLKFSLNAYSFSGVLNDYLAGRASGMSLFDLLDFCAEQNFDAIDPTGYFFPGYPKVPSDAYINDFKRRAFQLGLDISGTGVRNDFATPDKEKRAADVTMVKEWIEAAARMGAPVIRVFAGPEPEGLTREQVLGPMAEALSQCAEHGKKYGVLVGVQNHGDFIKTAEQAIEIVKRVDSDWFGIIVDTGNFQTGDPYESIASVIPHAVNWQIKESPYGKTSPIKTDLKRLMRIIKESGYRGYLPIETLSIEGQRYDPKAAVSGFLGQLRKALAETA